MEAGSSPELPVDAMTALKRFPFLAVVLAAFAMIPALASLALPERQPGDANPTVAGSPQINPEGKPPSDEDIRARADKLVANQHQDDQSLGQYERVEHHVDRTAGSNPRTLEDKLYRMVPTGAGTAKILLRDGGKSVDAATYNHQMQDLKDLLQAMANPNDPKAKAAAAKRAKRERDRAEFVDAARSAFNIRWIGTSTPHGRMCEVFQLDPNPNFKPHGMFQDALTHVTATVWVDQATDQMVRGEARVTSDISFGGGILGKLYRGGAVSMEQAEVAPGVWLPTHYQYDFAGRKFLFAFEEHQSIDATRYRRVGAPGDALLIVQAELASGKSFIVDP